MTNPSIPNDLAQRIEKRLRLMAEQDVCRRIWAGDHTVWKEDPTEISQPDRLGWLRVVDQMVNELPSLRRFSESVAVDGFEDAVVLGMGGSSLAPEVMSATFGHEAGALRLHVLDTTVPADILALERRIDLSRTIFIVASKSGTTIETLSHLAYFWTKRPEGAQFVAITDPGTLLERTARQHDFRRVCLNPDSLGGRYSALSYFGLVPASLAGVDLERLLESAHDMQRACDRCEAPSENPGAWLGAVLGEAALSGRDKLTFVLPKEIETLGYWLEQLVAESTGKEGRGIIPIEGEALGPLEVYGRDRLFVALGDAPELGTLEKVGQPVIRLPVENNAQLGAEFFRWEFATAVAGHVLGINPFDQPNVQQAKDATAAVLGGSMETAVQSQSLRALLGQVTAGDYIALQAFLPRSDAVRGRLNRARRSLRDRYKVATTAGFGPRYLHSTGQVHKGGPNTGVFIQLVDAVAEDIPIPGRPFSFGRLMRAQADGDFLTLQAAGRRIARTTLEELEEATA